MTTTLDKPRLARTGSLGPLSEAIIPAIPGKCYVYSSVFTQSKPLYALMDCKANKNRSLAQANELGREVHLHFGSDARVSSIKSAQSDGLIGDTSAEFDDVWVAPADIAIEDFYVLSAQRDSAKIAEICKAACHERTTSTRLTPGVIAVMTSAGKYGLFVATQLTPTSISIDACHVLLP